MKTNFSVFCMGLIFYIILYFFYIPDITISINFTIFRKYKYNGDMFSVSGIGNRSITNVSIRQKTRLYDGISLSLSM